ncbi:hypothetical protein [Rhizobium grahamii]|uniref:Uncharacterized protein n=1 Tax=Rhizobium grahamii TaxID=1120045 RepID=A0A370KNE2_9HYPH|nr:hypothetical protein [Rhizobium grahamii]RDJ10435.1 hypothetical protein B5K06_15450 [Rhizobium grahamii]
MTANDNRPEDHSTERHTAYEAQEKALSKEGRSLSAWALLGAVAFVVAVIVVAFSVWTSGSTSPAPRAPPGASSPSAAPPPTQNTN